MTSARRIKWWLAIIGIWAVYGATLCGRAAG